MKEYRLRYRALTLVLATTTVTAVSGCSSGQDDARPKLVVDGPVVAFDSVSTGGEMAAIVGGRVAYDGRCLTLDGQPALWPVGTTWDERASAVVLPDGTVAPAGAVLSGGGGMLTFMASTWPGQDEAVTLIQGCLSPAGQVVSFNTGGQPTSQDSPPV